MRLKALAILLLLLPVVSEAQLRIPRIGTRVGPPRNEPLPPQPPSIARELAYHRLPYSVESYPMIAHFSAPGYYGSGIASDWTSGGVGSLVQFRVARLMSLGLNMTSALWGGPAMMSSLEFGTRFGLPAEEHRLYPYVDARLGYMAAMEGGYRPLDYVDQTNPGGTVGNGNWSAGFGGVAGAGLEYGITRTLTLGTSASVIQTRMQRHQLYTSAGPASYRLTSYRYMVTLRYNPGRWVPMLRQDQIEH